MDINEVVVLVYRNHVGKEKYVVTEKVGVVSIFGEKKIQYKIENEKRKLIVFEDKIVPAEEAEEL